MIDSLTARSKEPDCWSKDTALIKARIRIQSKKAFWIDYLDALTVPQFSYNFPALLEMKMRWLPPLMWLLAMLCLSAHMYSSALGCYKWNRNFNRIFSVLRIRMQARAKRSTTGSFDAALKYWLHSCAKSCQDCIDRRGRHGRLRMAGRYQFMQVIRMESSVLGDGSIIISLQQSSWLLSNCWWSCFTRNAVDRDKSSCNRK